MGRWHRALRLSRDAHLRRRGRLSSTDRLYLPVATRRSSGFSSMSTLSEYRARALELIRRERQLMIESLGRVGVIVETAVGQ